MEYDKNFFSNVYFNAAVQVYQRTILDGHKNYTTCMGINSGQPFLFYSSDVDKAKKRFAKIFKPHGVGEFWFERYIYPSKEEQIEEMEHRILSLLLMSEMEKT